MKTIYFDCAMGAAGDMLTAALLELAPDREAALAKLNALGVPGVRFAAAKTVKCGITGTQMTVTVDGEEEDAGGHAHHHEHGGCGHRHDHVREDMGAHGHEHDKHGRCHDLHHDHGHRHVHRGMADIEAVVGGLNASESVRSQVLKVYGLIAAAESAVHGVPVTEIHFHEVGALDAVADIAAVCTLMEDLAPRRVLASPVNVGGGHVRCAHGVMPVPAPATALLLRGVPMYGGRVSAELCTPTGAALLKHFVADFCPMPVMTVSSIGYGMGKKDFEAANCVRAVLGESE